MHVFFFGKLTSQHRYTAFYVHDSNDGVIKAQRGRSVRKCFSILPVSSLLFSPLSRISEQGAASEWVSSDTAYCMSAQLFAYRRDQGEQKISDNKETTLADV